jgi:hypothetical protein
METVFQQPRSLTFQLAGALQAAIFNTLNGKAGLAGWRWMFVSRCRSDGNKTPS